MEKDELITTASIEEHETCLIDIEENLEPQHECCIYNVPKDLRKINKDAYTPQVISIGPLHYGEKDLGDMQKQKIRYKREFSKRITAEKLQELIHFIQMHEKRIRNCYEQMPYKFQKLDFVRMILYDSIFIIELFLRRHERKSDFLLDNARLKAIIRLDLQLLENQLPYFILNGLYMLAFPKPNPRGRSYPSFFVLSYLFIYDKMFRGRPEEMEVKHFVDLRRCVLTKKCPQYSSGLLKDLPCVLKLQKYGLNFRCNIRGQGLLDVNFENKKGWIPWLQVHDELQIPNLVVVDGTECLIRNVMALEQCHYPSETLVCNYIILMDCLINTEEDVDLLVEAGIISSYVGDNARIARMFNELRLQIDESPSCYSDIISILKEHYENPWNHTMTYLKSVYFNNCWIGAGTIAAILLLLFTLAQTVLSILQVV